MRALNEFLRTFKATYVVNNVLKRKALTHNQALYQQYGLKKSIYAPLSHADFSELPTETPWLDQSNAWEQAQSHVDFATFSEEMQVGIKDWIEKGYLILRGYFDGENVKAINEEVDHLLKKGIVDQHHNGKVFFAFRHSDLLKKVVWDRDLLRLMSFLLGRQMQPFQSLNFIQGSQQAAHSDSIHMTTHPLGNLTAIWIALEHVGPDNGPLVYYPGSHRLPYIMNRDFDHGGSRWRVGDDANGRYEAHIAKLIKEKELEAVEFHTEPGDLLIWHANLLHGGKAIQRKGATRKSMVVHYFAQDVICYHELTQRPALLPLVEYV
ncbi:MAG: phytanoyl-CoA dioxygenase family protein [Bacteroidota bacterium]